MTMLKEWTVSNKGLNEYETLGDDIIAVTLLRASGELGDQLLPKHQKHNACGNLRLNMQ